LENFYYKVTSTPTREQAETLRQQIGAEGI
jgi:hypothetical protein